MSKKESWRLASDNIIRELANVAPEDRLKCLQERVASLPDGDREMVAHFVSLTALIVSTPGQEAPTMSRHRHISLITAMSLMAMVILIVAGIYLVVIRGGDDGSSKFHILGSGVETSSVGVGCFTLAGLVFLFVARKALNRI
ncbi:hypothetical protein EYC79_05675 [Agrobacterium cavarae]|uniref:Transmembrane protein n=1 Tax=Agrobacterium cavarae TaxID=2528239 RepID=A0ABY1YB08_9HYPH|nr:hypothetical protein [Agrobacterium cavarae]TBN15915.1 hypothetical protein EYC79_05675 [Agrobacterium cavarae]